MLSDVLTSLSVDTLELTDRWQLDPLSSSVSALFFIHSCGTARENFFKHQDISSLVIISFILVTCSVLLGEIGSCSLLELKELMTGRLIEIRL